MRWPDYDEYARPTADELVRVSSRPREGHVKCDRCGYFTDNLPVHRTYDCVDVVNSFNPIAPETSL